jgi:hypothetical protein
LYTRSFDAGAVIRFFAGRTGRRTNSPPQFGQTFCKTPLTQSAQNVHSKEQIIASVDSGGKSLSQHSQFGRNASMSSSSHFCGNQLAEPRNAFTDFFRRYGHETQP